MQMERATRSHFLLVTVFTVAHLVGPSLCDLEVRLVGPTKYRGRLEVRRNESEPWGTVCDDRWDGSASKVVCRQLKLTGGREITDHERGSGEFYLDDVLCTGKETNLGHCGSNPWGQHNCRQSEQVGVACEPLRDIEVRLVGPTKYRGRLEVRRNESEPWGTVCDDRWNSYASKVVCRQLHFGGGKEITDHERGSGEFYLDDVLCTGNETNLGHCGSNPWGDHNCVDSEQVGVACEPLRNIEVRLVGPTEYRGRLEVRRKKSEPWGTVCDDRWDDLAAKVVCRQLNLTGGSEIHDHERGSGEFYLDDVLCTGNETNLGHCGSNPWGDHNCVDSEQVGVACEPLRDGGQ